METLHYAQYQMMEITGNNHTMHCCQPKIQSNTSTMLKHGFNSSFSNSNITFPYSLTRSLYRYITADSATLHMYIKTHGHTNAMLASDTTNPIHTLAHMHNLFVQRGLAAAS